MVHGGGAIVRFHGIHNLHMHALALVLHLIGQVHGLLMGVQGHIDSAYTPGHIGLGAMSQDKLRIDLDRVIECLDRAAAPTQPAANALFIGFQGNG